MRTRKGRKSKRVKSLVVEERLRRGAKRGREREGGMSEARKMTRLWGEIHGLLFLFPLFLPSFSHLPPVFPFFSSNFVLFVSFSSLQRRERNLVIIA